jgi:hypothetical protein
MYLSNRDIKWAIDCGKLIANPRPEVFNAGYDETSMAWFNSGVFRVASRVRTYDERPRSGSGLLGALADSG